LPREQGGDYPPAVIEGSFQVAPHAESMGERAEFAERQFVVGEGARRLCAER